MNFFDTSIIEFLNRFNDTKNFDGVMVFLVTNNFVKGLAIISIFWFFWFQKTTQLKKNRERIITAMASCLVAIVVARVLTLVLPFRQRPILHEDLHLVKRYGSELVDLGTMSSFPSDHAVMFFSLATGIFLISRRIGVLVYLYVLGFICFPRIYLGYHYPTDILAGALLGVGITLLISTPRISRPIIRKSFQFSSRYSGAFYVFFFLLMYEISTMFSESRVVGSYLVKLFVKGT